MPVVAAAEGQDTAHRTIATPPSTPPDAVGAGREASHGGAGRVEPLSLHALDGAVDVLGAHPDPAALQGGGPGPHDLVDAFLVANGLRPEPLDPMDRVLIDEMAKQRRRAPFRALHNRVCRVQPVTAKRLGTWLKQMGIPSGRTRVAGKQFRCNDFGAWVRRAAVGASGSRGAVSRCSRAVGDDDPLGGRAHTAVY